MIQRTFLRHKQQMLFTNTTFRVRGIIGERKYIGISQLYFYSKSTLTISTRHLHQTPIINSSSSSATETSTTKNSENEEKKNNNNNINNNNINNCHGSSLYLPFMGSSTRFTFNSRISNISDITALESESLSHSQPSRINDHCCIYLVKLLRWCADKLFRERYIHRATMLKTIAPAAPFSGAMVAYLRMMFKKNDAAFVSRQEETKEKENERKEGNVFAEIRGLMSQAESHSCHAHILMMMTEISYAERVAVIFLQSVHFIIFYLLFLFYPRMAFRLMGYLGEESVVIWTHMINDIDLGKVSEREIPQIAIDYWSLHKLKKVENLTIKNINIKEDNNTINSSKNLDEEKINLEVKQDFNASLENLSLRDVILLLRSDEMVWRDVSHKMANDIDQIQGRKKSFLSSFFS